MNFVTYVIEANWKKHLAVVAVFMSLPLVASGGRPPAPFAEPRNEMPRNTANPHLRYRPTFLVAAYPQDLTPDGANDKAAPVTPNISPPKATAKNAATTKASQSGTPNNTDENKVDSGQKAETGTEPTCCDANREFENWTLTLDDEIRQNVISTIKDELSRAVGNLDARQRQIERIQVEKELFRLQIEHLRSRLKEWEPPQEQ